MDRRLKAISLFVAVTLAVSWGTVVLAAALGGLGSEPVRMLLAWFFPAGPLAGALIVQRWQGRAFTAENFGVSLAVTPWLPTSWFLAVLIGLAVLGVELFLPGVSISFSPALHLPPIPADASDDLKKAYEASPVVVFLSQLAMAMFFGAIMKTLVSLAEEIGWRQVLLRELAVFGFWRAVILISALVALWSLPLIVLGEYYPNARHAGVAMLVAYSLLMTPLTTFLRLAANTVVAGALFEGTLGAMRLFVALALVSGSDLLSGVTGAAGFIVLLLANLLVVIPNWRLADDALRRLSR